MIRNHPEMHVMHLLAKKVNSEFSSKLLNPTYSSMERAVAEFDLGQYTDASTLSKDYMLSTLLKKWVGYSNPDKREKTITAWYAAERRCFHTNRRLEALLPTDPLWPAVEAIQKKIRTVIGTRPPASCFSQCKWSGGATFATKRGTSPCKKNAVVKTVTHAASFIAPWLMAGLQGDKSDFLVVPGNRACMVPKTAKIDRCIAIEPSANIFCQLGVGRVLRTLLRQRAGIDLDNQGFNQDAAFRAVVDNLATLDLEMASDTLSVECVRLLLPPAWFKLLAELRCERTLLEGKWVYLEKFSSMGNGYNFELESLIFWAICSVFDPDTLVYGDDIVVKASLAKAVISALTYFGFKVNESKSFSSGSFYESCGKHYFDLEDVTPVYQKEVLKTPLSYIRMHNRLIRWGIRTKNLTIVLNACKYLRNEYNRLFPDKPVGWTIGQSDVAFLGPDSAVRRDKHGDVIVHGAWVSVSALKGADTDDCFALWYKLFDPGYQNPCPRGHFKISGNSHARYKSRVRVWVSSVMDENTMPSGVYTV